jgi:hypothetical protein
MSKMLGTRLLLQCKSSQHSAMDRGDPNLFATYNFLANDTVEGRRIQRRRQHS